MGEGLTDLSGYRFGAPRPEASLIRPKLKVDLAHPDDEGKDIGYARSYTDLSPQTRGGYLRWLAEGRNRPGAAWGFVRLYYYGLERRLLVDMNKAGTTRTESPLLLAEVRRLLDQYGDDALLKLHANELLAAGLHLIGPQRYETPPPAVPGWATEMPVEIAFAIGQLIADGQPIPAEWAQAWWQGHQHSPQFERPTLPWQMRHAVTRFPCEFGQVFAALYAERFGDGMVLKPNNRTLKWQCRPFSPSLPNEVVIDTGVPDVRRLKAPFQRLAVIGEEAMSGLADYTQYVGNEPSRKGSPLAVALMPRQVQPSGDTSQTSLLEWAAAQLSGAPETSMPAAEVIRRCIGEERFRKADGQALATLLGRRKIGLEPDARFGGPPLRTGGVAVMFSLANPAVDTPGPGYLSAVAFLQLAGAVAAVDGVVGATETRTLIGHVSADLDLSADEQARLRAHLVWVTAQPPTAAALRQRAATLTAAQKEQAAKLLVTIAAADGQISHAALDVIARMFDVLGFDSTHAYSQVHALAIDELRLARAPFADPLAPARTAGKPAPGFLLPPRDPDLDPPPLDRPHGLAPRRKFALDPVILAQTQRSSEQVTQLLAGIFTDDEPTPPVAPTAQSPGDADQAVAGSSLVAGLDAAHSALLRALASRSVWSRSDLTTLCADHGLLPDGARDTLNEAALDATGDLVCDGINPIQINSDVLKEML